MSLPQTETPRPSVFPTLSKSDYKAARECQTKLYYREMRYPSADETNDYLRMLAHGGYMVEAVAKAMYPDGIALEYAGDPVGDAERTMAALMADTVTLFEATLLVGNKLARVDILAKMGNVFRLIEVKSKSFESDEHQERIAEGKGNLFRGKRKPYPIAPKWEPYLEDVTYQILLLSELFPDAVIQPILCMVDKCRRISFDDLPAQFTVERGSDRVGRGASTRVRFRGDVSRIIQDKLLCEIDVSAEVEELLPEVKAAADRFASSLCGGIVKLPPKISANCKECEYRVEEDRSPSGFEECWGPLANVRPSLLDLYQASRLRGASGRLVDELLRQGKAGLFDIPEDACCKKDGTFGQVAERQLLQMKHTRSGTEWIGEPVHEALARARYPLHFIDFEACGIALPPHRRMKPYGLLAFQWSCHTIPSPGTPPIHREWLNTRDYWPNAEFARTLRAWIGTEGTVLTWSPFEESVLKRVMAELSEFGEWEEELAGWIASLAGSERVIDMNEVTRAGYFTPGMGGRTSIKIVLRALWRSDPAMRARFELLTGLKADDTKDPYASLPPLEISGQLQNVVEGTGALKAYEAMMYGVERNEPATKAAWGRLLLQYCMLDTLAMLLIWERWQSEAGAAP